MPQPNVRILLSNPETAGQFGNLAEDAILVGDYSRAEQLLWNSLLEEMGRGSIAGEAADWGNLGVVAALQGNFRAATQHLRQALRLHRRLGDHQGIGCDFLHLGQIVGSLGRPKLSTRMLLQAIRHFQQGGLQELETQAGAALAELVAEGEARRRLAVLDPRRN